MGHTIERVALAPSHSRSSLLGGWTGHPNNKNIITLVGGTRRISTKPGNNPSEALGIALRKVSVDRLSFFPFVFPAIPSVIHMMAKYSLPFLSILLFVTSLCSAIKLPADADALAKRTSKLPDYAKRNLNTIRKIYNLTVYPNNVPIVNKGASAVPPGLFNVNATGRVSPVGNFTGFDDSIEYFFSLAPTPQSEAGLGFYEADVLEFTSGCPEVAASLVYLRTGHVSDNGTLDKTKPTTTLSQVCLFFLLIIHHPSSWTCN